MLSNPTYYIRTQLKSLFHDRPIYLHDLVAVHRVIPGRRDVSPGGSGREE